MKELKIKVTFITPVLGSQPADPEIYSKFIAANAPDAKTMKEEIEAMGKTEYEEKSMTVFPRTSVLNQPCELDYQVKGFFKDSCSALQRMKGEEMAKESCKLKAYKKIIDGCIFTYPRRMPIHFGGEITNLQRPLRAQTMQGERICLANSEVIPEGAWFECRIKYPDQYDAVVREWLDYGEFKGLGQWRNGGFGRFTWEEITD